MKTHLLAVLAIHAVISSHLAAQVEIYVAPAPTGSDANAGTLGSPFATLTKARNHLRGLQPLANGATVYLRGGEHFISGTFSLSGTQDSGSAGSPIVYAAYNGEEVIVSGAGTLDYADFSAVTDSAILNRVIDVPTRSVLMEVDLTGYDLGGITRRGWGTVGPAGGLFPADPQFELFVGEERQRLARWPNPSAAPQNTGDPKGSVDLSGVVDPGPVMDWGTWSTDPDYTTAGGTFSYNFATNRPALWTSATDIWLAGTLDRAWEWDYIPVASINAGSKRITLGQGTDSGITTSETFFHFENLLEEIDEPGEYYIDRASKMLYISPPAGFATEPIRFTSLQSTWMIRTSSSVSHVEFRDLIFEGTRNGGMELFGNHLQVRRCTFRNLRGTAMQVSGDDLGVLDSVFHDVGSRGIIVGAWGADSGIGDVTDLTPANVFIENCEFHHMAHYQANYTPSIDLLRGVSPRISHCYFHDNPHFSIGGHANNAVIEYCEFTQTPSLLADVGAIYYNTGKNADIQGTVIRRNYFHDIGNDIERGKMSGLYLDNASRGFTIEENIFQRIGIRSSDWAFFNHGASPVKFTNNVFVDCVTPVTHSYAMLLPSTYMPISNFIPTWESVLGAPGAANPLAGTDYLLQYPELQTLIPADGNYESRKAYPVGDYSRNLFYNPNVARLNASDGSDDGIEITPTGVSLAPGVLSLTDNFVATSDPGFTDLANDDLSFVPGAGVFTSISGFNDPEFKLAGSQQMGLIRGVGPRDTPAVPTGKTIHWDQGVFFTPFAAIDGQYQHNMAALATDTNAGATVTFTKVSGPDWLSVAPDGTVTGAPPIAELGLNHFGVRALSSTGETDEAVMRITTIDLGSGLEALVTSPADGSSGVSLLPTLTWSASAGTPDHYKVYLDGVLEATTTDLFHSVSGSLDPGHTYVVRVDAVFGSSSVTGPDSSFTTLASTVVDTIADPGTAGDGLTSLREAIAGAMPGASITFDPVVFSGGPTITLTSGELSISKDLEIDASGLANGVSISGGNASRIFSIGTGLTLSLDSLWLRDGQPGSGSGGAIEGYGSLQLDHCTLSDNSCPGDGGAINMVGYDGANPVTLTIANSTIANNYAGVRGGGIWNNGPEVTATITHSTIIGNHANTASYGGGGLRTNNSTASVENSILWGNTHSSPATASDIQGSGTTLVGANIVGAAGPTPSGPAAISADPLLAPLAGFGGPAPTAPPLPGSPAIEAAVLNGAFPTDQRGSSRPSGPLPDLGAVEAFALGSAPGFVDSDSDGIDDRLEIGVFGDTATANASSDADGDGSIDAHELANMTNPLDATDRFRIVGFAPAAGFDPATNPLVTVTVATFPGLAYVFESDSDLQSFTLISGSAFTADDFSMTFEVLLAPNENFVRVKRN